MCSPSYSLMKSKRERGEASQRLRGDFFFFFFASGISRICYLTQTDETFRELEDALKSSILRVRRAPKRDEQHEQTVLGRIQD